MKNALIIVGKELKYNKFFIEYLKREIRKQIGLVDLTLYIGKNDETITTDISDTIRKYKNVIIATIDGFELVGKILSTLTSDTLVYRSKILLPAKAEFISSDSYKVVCNNSYVNVLRINELYDIPKIVLRVDQDISMFIFCDQVQSERFEKLAHVFEVHIDKIEFIEGLRYYSLSCENKIGIERLLKETKEIITNKILIGDDLSSIIAQRLIEANKTITFTESCTGGLIASEFVKNSGVSSIFKGSIVSYANEVKSRLLGVKEETLEKFGAVSKECVSEMLFGVMKEFDSDFALAVSGVAGPDGGTNEKPVGTVIIGVKSRVSGVIIKKLCLNGDRIYIQQCTLLWALKLLFECDEKFFFKFVSKSLDK